MIDNLRDWFAGQALAGMETWCPSRPDGSLYDWNDHQVIQDAKARWAYQQADAMLAARNRKESLG